MSDGVARAWASGELRSPVTGAWLAAGAHDLHAGGERWPVVDGIAFLRADRRALADAALAALDAGDEEGAAVVLLADQDGWASTPPPGEEARRAVVRGREVLGFRDAMGLLAFGPVATYFAHRWSDPTFLSGLALAEAHWHGPAVVAELACGAGHFLREFARVEGVREVVGGDLVFAKLWLARHFVAPGARLVCFDAARAWPLGDASAALVFCHDALYFLPEKAHVAAEMLRVAGAGRVLVGHAHNAAVENLSHGAPLLPEEYAALFGHAALYDDRELTAALVEGRAPCPAPAAALQGVAAVALAAGVAGGEAARAVVGGLAVPAEGRAVRRNPLYEAAGGVARVAWPSGRYEAEYGALVTYPVESAAPERAVAGEDGVAAMVRRRELLDLPERW
ncbi:MAG: class I SAM-dependent methyltransferase [Janthinobacterium lividum]